MLRLNLGCCDLKRPGWVNIDNDPRVGPDVVADALDLPYEEGSVDEIYAAHLVEHLTPEEAVTAFKHWYALLKPGGKLCIVTPDFKELCKQYLAGAIPLEDMTHIYVFSYVQSSHHASLWDQESQINELLNIGFHDIKAINRHTDDRLFYGVDWQCGTEGVK